MGSALARLALVAITVVASVSVVAWREGGEGRACGAAGPFDFDTFEPEDYLTAYNRAIELAAAGKGITATHTVADSGEVVDLRYQGLISGPRGARSGTADKSLGIPPSIMKSIAWIEASWANGAAAVPYGGVGPVIRSGDCGYGIGQITTGMSNQFGVPSARQAAIGTHFMFNLAEGARILADKWNSAPRFRPVAGNGDPTVLEDWYYAIWSYNGFAFSNHPLNPNRDPLRGGGLDQQTVYHCYDSSAPSYQVQEGAVKYGYGDYTYPERVYGCMVHPPTRNGVRLWQSQAVGMPHFEKEAVSAAFDVEHFATCEDAGFSGGCPKMDYPTAFAAPEPDPSATEDDASATSTEEDAADRAIVPHRDTTPPIDANIAQVYLGKPVLAVEGPATAELTTAAAGLRSVTVKVRNVGTFVAPFRIRSTASWLVVRHANDPAGRTLDGGVAVGAETKVILQTANATRPRIAQDGYVSTLAVTLSQGSVPRGTSTATLVIEPLWGAGQTYSLRVTATRAEDDLDLPVRAVVVGTSSDGPSE
jgi:hypothetical protein